VVISCRQQEGLKIL